MTGCEGHRRQADQGIYGAVGSQDGMRITAAVAGALRLRPPHWPHAVECRNCFPDRPLAVGLDHARAGFVAFSQLASEAKRTFVIPCQTSGFGHVWAAYGCIVAASA